MFIGLHLEVDDTVTENLDRTLNPAIKTIGGQ